MSDTPAATARCLGRTAVFSSTSQCSATQRGLVRCYTEHIRRGRKLSRMQRSSVSLSCTAVVYIGPILTHHRLRGSHRRQSVENVGGVRPGSSLPFSSPLPPPSLSLLPLPLPRVPFPPLRSRTTSPARGLRSTVSTPAGSGAEPQPKSNWVHFSLKCGIWWQ